jgi:hypothetical protein
MVLDRDRQHFDLLADDGAWAGKVSPFVEGILEAHQLFVLVVGIDSDLVDQSVEV